VKRWEFWLGCCLLVAAKVLFGWDETPEDDDPWWGGDTDA
jgi:hypothetical protein